MTCWRWALAVNFTGSPQWAHVAVLPASTRRSTARLTGLNVVATLAMHTTSAAHRRALRAPPSFSPAERGGFRPVLQARRASGGAAPAQVDGVPDEAADLGLVGAGRHQGRDPA